MEFEMVSADGAPLIVFVLIVGCCFSFSIDDDNDAIVRNGVEAIVGELRDTVENVTRPNYCSLLVVICCFGMQVVRTMMPEPMIVNVTPAVANQTSQSRSHMCLCCFYRFSIQLLVSRQYCCCCVRVCSLFACAT